MLNIAVIFGWTDLSNFWVALEYYSAAELCISSMKRTDWYIEKLLVFHVIQAKSDIGSFPS
jgi:hypothetical protein